MRIHSEKVLWSDGFYHESDAGNDSQRDVHVYLLRIHLSFRNRPLL